MIKWLIENGIELGFFFSSCKMKAGLTLVGLFQEGTTLAKKGTLQPEKRTMGRTCRNQ
jgi:hypothetical protein